MDHVRHKPRTHRTRWLIAAAGAMGATLAIASPAWAASAPSFAPQTSINTGVTNTTGVVVADLNGDGKPDIATASYDGLHVNLGTGNGSFGPASNYAAPDDGVAPFYDGSHFITTLASADLNGDGKPDLVATDSMNDQVVIVWLNQGNGTFAAGKAVALNPYSGCATSSTLPCYASPYGQIAIGDFNGDGKPDIATAATDEHNGYGGELVVVFGKGDGTFSAPAYLPLGKNSYGNNIDPQDVATGDLYGDGHLDLVSADNSGYNVQNPDGSYTTHLTDFVTILRGNGHGSFASPVEVHTGVPGPTEVKVADVNRDHKPDLLVLGGGKVTVLLNKGHGQFGAPKSYALPKAAAYGTGSTMALADVNRDGNPDLIVGLDTFGNPSSVAVFPGTASGTFGSPVVTDTGATGLYNIAAGDLNHDGRPDIVTANSNKTGQDISVLLNTTR